MSSDPASPDVVFLRGDGGVVRAVLRPIVGADKVARLVAARWDIVGTQTPPEPVQVMAARP